MLRSALLVLSLIAALSTAARADLSASATVSLVSVTGPVNDQTYNYRVDVTDSGDTNIGTFWYAWIPGYDFLTSNPTITDSPPGWYAYPSGSGPPYDGYSIQWYNYGGDDIQPGQTFSFGFSSGDSPAVLSGNSPVLGYPMQTSYVYIGGFMADPGFRFTLPAVVVPEPATISMLAAGSLLLMRRQRHA